MSLSFSFNQSNLKEILPGNTNPESWHELACQLFPKYNINTVERVAGFMAQTGHESRDWSVLEENLNYSASALNRVFSKYFRNVGVSAWEYHRQPEKIANRVYANRMGNGPEDSGDGWKYRGRGLIQITGRYNYERFCEYTGLDFDRIVDYVSTPTGALESACWYWKEHGLNDLADRQDILGMTRRINGGYNGLDDRKARYRLALDCLSGDDEESEINTNQILKMGSRGETVRAVQEKLGIVPDGIFGPKTKSAIMNYQKQKHLAIDGILGPETLGVLFS